MGPRVRVRWDFACRAGVPVGEYPGRGGGGRGRGLGKRVGAQRTWLAMGSARGGGGPPSPRLAGPAWPPRAPRGVGKKPRRGSGRKKGGGPAWQARVCRRGTPAGIRGKANPGDNGGRKGKGRSQGVWSLSGTVLAPRFSPGGRWRGLGGPGPPPGPGTAGRPAPWEAPCPPKTGEKGGGGNEGGLSGGALLGEPHGAE